jgi:hypothetical protein
MGRVLSKPSYLHIAAVMLIAAGLASCAAQQETTIVADDQALCHYSEIATGAELYARCRTRLESQRARLIAANASHIEGYALLQTAAPPADWAARCKSPETVKDCPSDDVTGSIKPPTKP